MAEIVGTPGHDTLRGTGEADRILGLAGDDDIDGGAGDDVVLSFLIDSNGDLASIRDYDDFLAASRDTEAGVLVTLGGFEDAAVLIEGVSLAEISAANLAFTAIDF